MRQKRFLIYLLVQALVIIAVTIIFKLNSDRKIAATEAGTLFILMPAVLMCFEASIAGFSKKSWFVGMLQFWIFFAVPVMGLRLLNWDADFKDLSFLGVSGPDLHYWSNKSYLLMMSVTVLEAWKNYRLSHKNKKPV